MSKPTQYFASKPQDELAHDLENRFSAWANGLNGNGTKARWIKSYNKYFGRHFTDSQGAGGSGIKRGGKEGELTLVTVNHYRNLIKHQLILTTNQKPSFDVRAVNSDFKSLQQAALANNVLDAYLKEKRLYRYLKAAAEQALVFGKGFVKVTWEPSQGRPAAVEDYMDQDGQPKQRVVYEGDVDVQTISPFDVFVDQSIEDFSRTEWVLIREFKNKFNLAARYHDLEDKILGLPTKNELDGASYTTLQELDETADVPVYAFYHKRTEAMPNGRYVLFANADTVLYDGPIPYRKLPIFRITPGDIFGSTEGYSDAFDLMDVQEVMDNLASAAFSSLNAYGVQNILVPEGCNLNIDQISESLAVLKYNPQAGKPEALQLTQIPDVLFQMYQLMERTGETLSGVNSVARGNPESQMGKDSSGSALALIQSMAVQYSSGFQQSWAELLEDVGTFILDLLRDFAKTDRMVALAGKHKKGAMQSFKGDDLKNVDRVIVELGNPMARTTSGRVAMADSLLQKGLIKTTQEYITVMNTGQLDPIVEGIEADVGQVRKENEELMEGRHVQALVSDAHLLHMQEHRTVVSDPQLRQRASENDPEAVAIVQNALSHIQEHMDLYQGQNPLWSQVAGEPPAPPQQMPMMPPGMPPEQGGGDMGAPAPMMPPPGMAEPEMPAMPEPAQPPEIAQPV